MSRTIYRVQRDGLEWIIMKQDEAKPYWRSEIKSNLVALARKEAQENRPSKLVVEKEDGTVQAEYTYDAPPDDDPNPPST